MTENQQTERQVLQRHTHAQSTMLTSTLLLGYSRFPVARLVIPKRIVHHIMTCPWHWRRTRSHMHFRLPPLVVPPWPVLTVCDHSQRVALTNRLSHTASSFFTRHPHVVMCCPDTHNVFTTLPGAILSTTQVGIRVDSCHQATDTLILKIQISNLGLRTINRRTRRVVSKFLPLGCLTVRRQEKSGLLNQSKSPNRKNTCCG